MPTPGFDSLNELSELYQREGLTPQIIARFQSVVWDYYHTSGRSFPWRETRDPYSILVSEVMLQQTQTSRVVEKYLSFLRAFPDFATLASAPLGDVLREWQGLGYNRRAISLHRIAQKVTSAFSGQLPSSPEVLLTLPGIGPYTAAAVAALAFGEPAAFVETNVREVYLRSFFADGQRVSDREILPLVAATLDRSNVREWYFALYDYGAAIKKTGNANARSAHYHKQSPFRGSNRQLRGRLLKLLLAEGSLSEADLTRHLGDDARLRDVVDQLKREGFIVVRDGVVALP